MKRNLNILWGLLLIGGGFLFLAQNFGYLDNVSGYLWTLVFGIIGGSFIYLFSADRARWWALIPGTVLLTLAVMFGLNTWNVELFDPWSGTFVLGGVALAFWLVFLARRDYWWALIPAGVLTTLAIIARLDNVSGVSTGAILFFGIAATFLLVLLTTRMRWAIFPAAGLALLGVVILFGQSQIINFIWPVALIAVGLFLLFSSLEASEKLMRAIRVHAIGGPEVLTLDSDVSVPQPGAGEVLIKVGASGVNFIDVYHRIGRYPQPLPFIPGTEAAGVVAAVGSGVAEYREGDRVACYVGSGGYAEYLVAPVVRVVALPAGLDDRSAAAALVQGLTAHYLAYDTYPVKPGDTVLVHAAAGGVGLLLTQIAKRRGAQVIATVSTEAKAQLAREAGADEIILYSQTDFEAEVKRLTNGRGLDCVYDSVGKTTFDKSLNCLRPLGYLVLYGAASGPVPPIDPIVLMNKGSLFLTRPTLGHYIATPAALRHRAADLFGWIAAGELKLRLEHTYPLAEAAQAHRDLEARATTGKLLLLEGAG